ncbi:MAG: ATP-grasp domain-containing protein [bacterium]
MRSQFLTDEARETSEVIYTNVNLDPDKAYFLYVGEIKAYWLNSLMKRPLEKLYGKEIDFIAVVPDVLTRPSHRNLVVINSSAMDLYEKTGIHHNVRIPGSVFAAEVSANMYLKNLVDMLVDRQGSVYINMFESKETMSLVDGDSVRLVGPDPKLAHFLNNKLIQYEIVKNLGIPVPSGCGNESLASALESAKQILEQGHSVFVSGEYSAAGSNSIIADSVLEIEERFGGSEGKFIVTRFIEHEHDPTVLGIVAGEDQVYIATVADQNIVGTQFKGSTYPTVLGEETVRDLKEMTRQIGAHIGKIGYRGVFGCDYIVGRNQDIHFIEINARKQGTTFETTLTMMHHLPGHPYFPELEFMAVTEGRLPEGIREIDMGSEELCWGTHNFKVNVDIEIHRHLTPEGTQFELFENAYKKEYTGKRYLIEDHVGDPIRQKAGGFLARVIAVADNCGDVQSALSAGAEEVKRTFREVPE